MADIDVEAVLAKLTSKNKLDLLAGIDFWHTKALPEHGIPSLRLSDGPNGVRGTAFFNGVPAACFPCGTGLGATWNKKLLYEAGEMMATESIAKGAHVILGPCINMQRSPLGGRGFESLSEDPVLAGLGSAALVNGIQSKGVLATVKHFTCNDQEHERNAYSANISERALREIYLLPFQLAVRDSHPHAFMTAYNKINGVHMSENKRLLQDVLRDEWQWDGLVMSDWWGTYTSHESINAGLDLEMPGPTRWRGNLLDQAISTNKVTKKTIDDRARAVLKMVKRCAASGIKENQKMTTNDTPETSKFMRRLANEAIVLMKNEGSILPFKKDKTTLIVGPNAKVATYCGGGSAGLPAYYAITPFDGISSKLTQEAKYTVGSYAHKELPLLNLRCKTASGEPGMTFRAYNEPPTFKDREVVDDIHIKSSLIFLADYVCEKIKTQLYYATVEGIYEAEEDGDFELGLCTYGTADLYVDGKLIIDNSTKQTQGDMFFGIGTVEETGTIAVKKGQNYHLKVEFASAPTTKLERDGVVVFGGGGVRIGGCMIIDPEAEIKHAAALAKEVDQVIICGGLNSDWEGEGNDRVNMDLPATMDALISAITLANPNTAVVMQSGTPVTMPWLSTTPALLQAWYGGNECGNAIADVLFGDVNPSGKASLSFPKRLQDNPAYLQYRSDRGNVVYGEDVYVGYRYYEAVEREVNFAFGHGLSYTTFEFSGLKIKEEGKGVEGKLSVSVDVKNTGSITGSEVVQVYVKQEKSTVNRPKKELRGFNKIELAAGESKVVEVELALKYAASFWDESREAWIVEKGKYEVLVGNSSVEGKNTLVSAFEVAETFWWNGI